MNKAKDNGAVEPNATGSDELPEGWAATTLGDVVVEVQPGFACGVNNRAGDGVAHLRPMNVNTEGAIDLSDVKYVPVENVDSERKWLRKGDVLFNNTNSTELVGKTAFYNDDEPRAFSNHMTRVRVHEDAFDPDFCAAYLHNCWRDGHFQEVCNQHVSQSSVSRTRLLETSLWLPPFAEQKRIVAKVEALLERVSKARERLNRVPDILKNFRQSVLAAACSGRLTADWREENGDAEDLPASWERRSLSSLCSRFEYGSSKKSESDGGVPVLRMGNIQGGEIDWSDLKFTSDDEEIEKYTLEPNTVLFNRTNSPELVGKTGIYRGERPAVFAGYLIRIHHGPDLNPEYLNYCLNAVEFREYCSQVKTDGVSQSNINAKKLAAYEMPWCELGEQNEIVCRVKMLFEVLTRVAQHASFGTRRTELVTQSVLAKAFAGELVETEADLARREGRYYEPASVLLQRLAAGQSETTSAIRLERGRAVLDILLLLEAWNQPVSISALEPALVLMRNDAARQVLLTGRATRRRRHSLSNEPQFVRGLDVIYCGLVANGAIRRVGQAGFELANSQLLSQANAADRAKAAEVIRAIQTLSDLRNLSQVVASLAHEQYEITV